MSGFGGSMKEYKNVSIDRFDKTNLNSTVFLLSHCHRDHMIGLDQPGFVRCLKSREGIYLYCSEVTKLLLLSESVFSHLAPFIKVMEIGVSTTVPIPDPQSTQFKSVVVTCLPAAHCPGSVMFLFEGNEGTALYTGDFRWEKNYTTMLPALCVNGQMKPIDSMYVDTTFCVPEAFFIPSREDCLAATASLVTSWLQRSPHHFVHVSSRSKYGHEPLLAHLAYETKSQVHAGKAKVSLYDQISELQGVFTIDPNARIHACTGQGYSDCSLLCGYAPAGSHTSTTGATQVMTIRPSTMWFTAEPSRLQELVVAPASCRGMYRVCYSFHSSYSELRDFISLLRPARVFPNVLPASDSGWDQVTARLQNLLTYKHKSHLSPTGDSVSAKPLGLIKRKRRSSLQRQSFSEELVFDSPDKAKQSCLDAECKDPLLFSQKSTDPDIVSPSKSVTSDVHSSYQGSDHSDLELDLFTGDDGETPPVKNMHHTDGVGRGETTGLPQWSSMSYVSGDEEMEEEEDRISHIKFSQAGDGKHAVHTGGTGADWDKANCQHMVHNSSTHAIGETISGSQHTEHNDGTYTDLDTSSNGQHVVRNDSEHADGDSSSHGRHTVQNGGAHTDGTMSHDPVLSSKKTLFHSGNTTVDAGLCLSASPPKGSQGDSQDIIVIHSSQSSAEECKLFKIDFPEQKLHSPSGSSVIVIDNHSSSQGDNTTQGPGVIIYVEDDEKNANHKTQNSKTAESVSPVKVRGDSQLDSYDSDATLPPDSPIAQAPNIQTSLKSDRLAHNKPKSCLSHSGPASLQTNNQTETRCLNDSIVIDLTQDDKSI